MKITILCILTVAAFGASAADAGNDESDFVSVFDGKSMTGWVGNVDGYEAKEGILSCLPGKGNGGNVFHEKEYDNFVLRFEFKLTPGANNGLGLRCPLEGKPSSKGFESQILDNTSKRYAKLKDTQYGTESGRKPKKRTRSCEASGGKPLAVRMMCGRAPRRYARLA